MEWRYEHSPWLICLYWDGDLRWTIPLLHTYHYKTMDKISDLPFLVARTPNSMLESLSSMSFGIRYI